MKEQVVLVNQFVGPSYTKGLIGFRYNNFSVPFVLGDHHDSEYHLTMSDITALAASYPSYISTFNRTVHRTYSNWGENVVEIGLCDLMMDNKLLLYRLYNGSEVPVRFKWIGDKWIPRERLTKR